MNVAVIPARGGSKRIPRKNVKQFYGKPIITWPIEVAKQSELFDHILVSTDDEEIANAGGGDANTATQAILAMRQMPEHLTMKECKENSNRKIFQS